MSDIERHLLVPRTRRLLPCILLALAVTPYAWSADDQPVIEWMRANAIRLETPEAGHGFTDMQPLKQVVGNARIVALGEASSSSTACWSSSPPKWVSPFFRSKPTCRKRTA